MDLQEMTNYIKTRYATDLGDLELTAHLNEAYRDLSTVFTPDVTETYEDVAFVTADGEGIYQLPVLSRQIKQVHLDTAAGIIRIRTMMEESLLYPRRTGVPVYWYSFGFKEATAGGVYQEFGLDPIPDVGVATSVDLPIHVLYEPVPVALENNADEPEYVPEEMHHLMCYKTIAVLAQKQEDYNTAQSWNALYTAGYNDALMKLGRSRYANFPEATRRIKGQ